MSHYLPEDTCLQCNQSRARVKRDDTICGIESGYEYRELEMEWPRHHWRDWSDTELRAMRITGHRWSRLRRAPLADLEWEIVESICDREGHREPPADGDEFEWFAPGRCGRCYAPLTEAVSHV